MSEQPVKWYELRILASESARDELLVFANLPGMLQAVEDDLTDLLPEGWTAQICPVRDEEEIA